MKTVVLLFAAFFASLIAINVYTTQASAQLGQLFQTTVGDPQRAGEQASDPNETNPGGSNTGSDNLGPGEFRVPWRCKMKYYSDTYTTHSAYSIDVNWGLAGQDVGHPIFAAADGTVSREYRDTGLIIISHQGGYHTLYQHMWPVLVRVGDRVKAGQKVGELNDRGAQPGQHHLHFNVCKDCGGDLLYKCQIPTPYTNRGCRIQVKFKGYKEDPNSNFPGTERNKYFYYDKGC